MEEKKIMREKEIMKKIGEIDLELDKERKPTSMPKTITKIKMSDFAEKFNITGDEELNVGTLIEDDEIFIEVKQGQDFFIDDKPTTKEEYTQLREKIQAKRDEEKRLRDELYKLWKENKEK